MIEIEREIAQQVAQGATEMTLLRNWLNLYEKDSIDFEELMLRVEALNKVFGKAYDVSQLDKDSSANAEESAPTTPEEEEAKADELFGMNEKQEQEEQSTMEDEEL